MKIGITQLQDTALSCLSSPELLFCKRERNVLKVTAFSGSMMKEQCHTLPPILLHTVSYTMKYFSLSSGTFHTAYLCKAVIMSSYGSAVYLANDFLMECFWTGDQKSTA